LRVSAQGESNIVNVSPNGAVSSDDPVPTAKAEPRLGAPACRHGQAKGEVGGV
jgi:hypothetical protein